MSDDQLRQYRDDIKKVVPHEYHEAIDRVPCYDFFPDGAIGKIVKVLPQKIRGLTIALVLVAGSIVSIMVMDDNTEQWYQHHKALVDGCAAATSDVEVAVQQRLESPEFWHESGMPHDPTPIPLEPMAEIGIANTSNTSSTVHGFSIEMPLGSSFVSITGPSHSLAGVEVINLKKKPLT